VSTCCGSSWTTSRPRIAPGQPPTPTQLPEPTSPPEPGLRPTAGISSRIPSPRYSNPTDMKLRRNEAGIFSYVVGNILGPLPDAKLTQQEKSVIITFMHFPNRQICIQSHHLTTVGDRSLARRGVMLPHARMVNVYLGGRT
jgi:hypothetical protein